MNKRTIVCVLVLCLCCTVLWAQGSESKYSAKDIFVFVLVVIYGVVAWNSLTYIQNRMGLTLFMNMKGLATYIFWKIFISMAFGWLAIPIAIIHNAVTKKKNIATNNNEDS